MSFTPDLVSFEQVGIPALYCKFMWDLPALSGVADALSSGGGPLLEPHRGRTHKRKPTKSEKQSFR